MNKRKLVALVNEIEIKNSHLKRMRTWLLLSSLLCTLCVGGAWWGYSQSRLGVAIVLTVFGVLTGLFVIMVIIGLHNGKKHVLELVSKLERGR